MEGGWIGWRWRGGGCLRMEIASHFSLQLFVLLKLCRGYDGALLYRVWRGKRKITPTENNICWKVTERRREKRGRARVLKWQSLRWMTRNSISQLAFPLSCFFFFLHLLENMTQLKASHMLLSSAFCLCNCLSAVNYHMLRKEKDKISQYE